MHFLPGKLCSNVIIGITAMTVTLGPLQPCHLARPPIFVQLRQIPSVIAVGRPCRAGLEQFLGSRSAISG